MCKNGSVEGLSVETTARDGNFHILSLNFTSSPGFEIMIVMITMVCYGQNFSLFREIVEIHTYIYICFS
jgi:hypothetical protein